MFAAKPYFLIADDDPDDQFMLQDMIEAISSENAETRFVENGVELIQFLKQLNGSSSWPNLVILDLNMPKMDGRQALDEIKSDPKLAAIPIVVMTTSQVDEDIHYCQQAGVNGYYQKPSSISDLRDIITHIYQAYF
jgi:CheY-like chemotaxis protein